MTVIAVAPEAAAMCVVSGMAADARLPHLKLARHRLPMTSRAFEILVRAVESKARALVVIEPPDVPCVGVVTVVALCPQRSFVLIVRLVTGVTAVVVVSKLVVGVTRFTGRHRVQAQERKRSQVVVE